MQYYERTSLNLIQPILSTLVKTPNNQIEYLEF